MLTVIKDWMMAKRRKKKVAKEVEVVSERPMTEAELRADGFHFLKLKGTKKVFAKNGTRIAIEG